MWPIVLMHSRSETVLIKSLGLAIRVRRERQGLSQEQLAEKAGIDRSFVSRIERGLANPSFLLLVRISRALRIGVVDLVQATEERHEES